MIEANMTNTDGGYLRVKQTIGIVAITIVVVQTIVRTLEN
jgi:hypothetical protein